MIRKLVSLPLCVLALLLLMGASAAPQQSDALLAEEESAALNESALETEAQVSIEEEAEEENEVPWGLRPIEVEEEPQIQEEPEEEPQEAAAVEPLLLVDGAAAPATVGRFVENGVTYVALAPMAQVLDSTVTINWDGTTATVYSDKLNLTARVGELYLVANGRYLYIPEGVRMVNNMVTVPLTTLAEAFGATLTWNGTTGVTQITRGTGGIVPGDAFYNQNDLFWLSRVIYAESGNQSLEGQMAVGNVVMNRVAHPAYPNTVEGVLAQKNQFSTYKSGALANRTPTEKCVIAAKLVLDGGEVTETEGALYFDSARSSWASRNRQYAATLGGHTFYY